MLQTAMKKIEEEKIQGTVLAEVTWTGLKR